MWVIVLLGVKNVFCYVWFVGEDGVGLLLWFFFLLVVIDYGVNFLLVGEVFYVSFVGMLCCLDGKN